MEFLNFFQVRIVNSVSLMLVISCRPASGHILEALHVDPASGVSLDKEKVTKVPKPVVRYSLDHQAKASSLFSTSFSFDVMLDTIVTFFIPYLCIICLFIFNELIVYH